MKFVKRSNLWMKYNYMFVNEYFVSSMAFHVFLPSIKELLIQAITAGAIEGMYPRCEEYDEIIYKK